MNLFKQILSFVDGKKTHALALAGLVIAGLMTQGIAIPPAVWVAVGSAGISTIRSAMKKLQ